MSHYTHLSNSSCWWGILLVQVAQLADWDADWNAGWALCRSPREEAMSSQLLRQQRVWKIGDSSQMDRYWVTQQELGIADPLDTKANEDQWRQQSGWTWRWSRNQRLGRKSKTCGENVGYKRQWDSFVRGPSSGAPAQLFLCSFARTKWLYEMRHLIFCHGKRGFKAVGKPCLWVGCAGVQQWPIESPESLLGRGSGPSRDIPGIGRVLARKSHEWSDWKISLATYTHKQIS